MGTAWGICGSEVSGLVDLALVSDYNGCSNTAENEHIKLFSLHEMNDPKDRCAALSGKL